ncbi:MAG: rhomboid family intramembrane serine protease [Nannocystaceae bacterium]
MTTALILLCSLAFAATLAFAAAIAENPLTTLLRSLWSIDSDAGLIQLGALELTAVWLKGQWWRLATAALLHGSWLHLLLNLSALWSIGEWLEPALGSRRTALLFLVSALGGSLASLAWCEAPVVVGASGGILGLAGALWLARVRGPEPLRTQLEDISANALAVMIALCLGLGLVVPVIAQAGHVGGLIAGSLYAAHLLLRGPVRCCAIPALTIVVGLGIVEGAAPTDRANYHLYLGFKYLELSDAQRALEAFEAALILDPDDAETANAVAYHLALAGQALERADTLADQALSSQPDNADFLDTKGWIACRRGDAIDGRKWLKKARRVAETTIPELEEHVQECDRAPEIEPSPTR